MCNWSEVQRYSSVQFSRSVVSYSLQPHESQHTRPPSLSPTPGVYPNPCPLSWWYHPSSSSSVIPFSSRPQSPPSIKVSSNESTLHMMWPKYWSFSFSISPSVASKSLISEANDQESVFYVRRRPAPQSQDLMIQGLRLWALCAGGLGSIPGPGTRSHMPQLRHKCHNSDPVQPHK